MKPAKDLYAAMMLSPARPSLARKENKTDPLSKKDIKVSEKMFKREKAKKMAKGGTTSRVKRSKNRTC